MSNKNQINKTRKIGALVAYTTLAFGLVSLGVYVYRQQQKSASAGNDGSSSRLHSPDHTDQRANDGNSQDQNSSTTQNSTETILWNPSPDPTTPNYGFVEGAIPLLFHLAENFNLHLILLCSPLQTMQEQQDMANGIKLTVQEQDEIKQRQLLGQQRERDQILTMFQNAGLISAPGTKGPKLIDPRQFLICETEEGVGHVVRHLESQVHVEARPNVVDLVQGVVPKVVFVQKKAGHSRQASSAARDEDVMTRSHVRVRSESRSSSSSSAAGASGGSRRRSEEEEKSREASGSSSLSQPMGDSFVEVLQSSPHEPLVSGYVTQAGRKGYLEVTDQLMRSSLNPEYTN
ncbi:hypothetical protein BGZ83_002659 [Gryganskiella cystojenkinii]|nr:hypothetical protein BGZ83_002659 [Gryganskiella cystojenkinii]